MTWYDHETESIWSQPWGRALQGELKGTQLQIMPFSLVPWSTWLEEHIDSVVLLPDERYGQQFTSDDFVVGVAIGAIARAYPYRSIAEALVINDTLGEIPLVIYTNPETRNIRIFVRQLSDGTVLEFGGSPEELVDTLTNSTWDTEVGLAIDGDLKGEALREIPYISSFDWAWLDFYPHSDFYDTDS